VGRAFPLPINTPRLLLRRLEPEDTVSLARLGSDEELLTYHWLPATDEEDAAKWIERDAKVDLTQYTSNLYLAVNLRDNERLIGLVSIGRTDQNYGWVEVTVVIERSEQRKGYGTEALQGLLEFGFCGLTQHRITAQCDARNVAFVGLAAKVGLRQEGTFFETRFVKGKWFDTAYFAMLKKEFDGAGPESPST
jgi:RimJ/RimL family protein N-acetyltransferase